MPIQDPSNGHQQAADQLRLDSELIEIEDPNSKIQNEELLSSAELAEIWARRAYALAEVPPAPATGKTVELLLFRLAGERYGIEVTNVREIHPLEQLTPVPRTPNFVAGVFSARGRILSVIDLRAFFGLPAPAVPSRKRDGASDGMDQAKIIVVTNTNLTSEKDQMEVGILADEVSDVVTIFKEDIEPPLITHTGPRVEHLHGITPDMLVVLNLNALLNDKDLIVYEEIG